MKISHQSDHACIGVASDYIGPWNRTYYVDGEDSLNGEFLKCEVVFTTLICMASLAKSHILLHGMPSTFCLDQLDCEGSPDSALA